MGTDRESEEDTGMSQEEVITWLAAHPGWHRTLVIARDIRKGYSATYESLRALANHGEIQRRSCGSSAKCGLEWSI